MAAHVGQRAFRPNFEQLGQVRFQADPKAALQNFTDRLVAEVAAAGGENQCAKGLKFFLI